MPRCCSSTPRKKLPPPTTIATWTPLCTTSAICAAIEPTTSGSTPSWPPPKASPDSLSRTLLYAIRPTPRVASYAALVMNVRRLPHRVTAHVTLPASCRSIRSGPGSEAYESGDLDALALEKSANGLLVVGDRRLVEQAVVLVERAHAALDDASDGSLGLALLACRRLGDAGLAGHDVRRDVGPGEVLRRHRCDLQSNVVSSSFVGTNELHEHADLRRQVLGALVKVRVGRAVETCHGDELDLLADLGRDRRDGLGHGLAGGERDGLSGGDRVGPGLVDSDDDLLGERDELVVLGDEVGLGAELDERRAGGRHDAVGSITVGTLGQLRGTGDPEQLGGLDEVAIGLSECLLSVHHPGPGLVPELLHIGSSDCHVRCTSLCWSGW